MCTSWLLLTLILYMHINNKTVPSCSVLLYSYDPALCTVSCNTVRTTGKIIPTSDIICAEHGVDYWKYRKARKKPASYLQIRYHFRPYHLEYIKPQICIRHKSEHNYVSNKSYNKD